MIIFDESAARLSEVGSMTLFSFRHTVKKREGMEETLKYFNSPALSRPLKSSFAILTKDNEAHLGFIQDSIVYHLFSKHIARLFSVRAYEVKAYFGRMIIECINLFSQAFQCMKIFELEALGCDSNNNDDIQLPYFTFLI